MKLSGGRLVDGIAFRADFLVGLLLADGVRHLVDIGAEMLTPVQNFGDDLSIVVDGDLNFHRHWLYLPLNYYTDGSGLTPSFFIAVS